MGDPADPASSLVELARLARSLEAGGIYNGAKLVRALLDRELARAAAAPLDARETGAAVVQLAGRLEEEGEDPRLVTALRAAADAAGNGRTLPLADAPRAWACRTCGRIWLESVPDWCPECEAPAVAAREQIPVWYLEPMSPAEALTGLEDGLELLEGLVDGRPDDALAIPPRPGEWSVRETLQHLVAAERLLSTRIPRILAEDDPELSAVAAWVLPASDEATAPSDLPASALLATLREMRRETLHRLRGLEAPDWARTGRHPEWGSVTIASQAAYFTRHLWSHLAQVRAAARSGSEHPA